MEMPTMLAATYGSTNQFAMQAKSGELFRWQDKVNALGMKLPAVAELTSTPAHIAKEPPVAQTKRRLVRVLVVDPSDSVPVDRCLLHAGAEQFTDSTDQELFFDIDIRSILEKHNEYRVTLDDKSSKAETPKKLEPARIRDLKMVVVTLAEF